MLKVKLAGAAAVVASTPLAAVGSGAGTASLCWQERHNQAMIRPKIIKAIIGRNPRDLRVFHWLQLMVGLKLHVN